MIDIWNDSLESIGRWPFDREYHAALLDALKDHGAASVGLDILFVEPSGSDDALARAAAGNGRVFFCEAMHAADKKSGRPESPGVQEPLLPLLRQAAAGVAHVNATVDPDGKRRRVSPVIWENGKPRFHLGLLLAMDRLGVKESDVRWERGAILLGDKMRIPVDEHGETLVRFHGVWSRAFEHVSYLEVLASYRQALLGEKSILDLERLRGRVCIVGLTATGTHDINPTPVDPMYPQVGIHADFFQNVIDGDFVTRLPRWANLLIAAMLAGAGWMIARVKNLPAGAAASVGTWTVFVILNTIAFVFGGRWADLIYPSALFWTVYLCAIVLRTMQEKRKREMLEAELTIASKIQRSFLPSSLPEDALVEMEVYMRPAKHVGGDLYAALRLDQGHLGLMCGDVSGKGMPAALFMARSVAEFKFCAAATGLDPAETLKRLNNGISEGDSSGLFVTMNYAVIDLKGRKLSLSNGGHMPVLRVRADGSSDQLSPDGGMPIGLVGDVEFGLLQTDLEPGDIFLMYSDGISEARNRKAEDFEMERLTQAVVGARAQNAAGICKTVLTAVEKFVGDAPQHDDMTLFVFKVKV